MKLNNLRRLLPLALMACFGVAQAQFVFSGSASYSMNPNSGTINWLVNQDTVNGTIDFTQNAPAFKVGGSTQFVSGLSTITYNVTSTAPIWGGVFVFQGDVELAGEINIYDTATSGANTLATSFARYTGSSYAGGVDGAFTHVVTLGFNQAVTSFSISEQIAIDDSNNNPPTASLAMVGTVEHNFSTTPVPEPASIAGLALGAVALLRRKRK